MSLASSSRGAFARGLALAVGLLGGQPATAQESTYQDLTSLSIEELAHVKISSASRHLEDAQKAPSAVTVITRDEITRYGWRTLAELLRSAPGFYSAYDRNYSWIGVRGFLQSADFNARFLLLIDGHRVNENMYDSGLVGAEFPLDLDLIERVEIVRGPSSSMYGTNAMLAVVNVITRRPQGEAALEVGSDVGSFLGRSGRVTLNVEKGRWAGLVSGTFYRNPGAAQLYFKEFDTPETNFGIAQNVDGGSSGRGFIDLQHGNLRLQGLYGSRLKVVPTGFYETNFNDPLDRNTDTRGYADVSYRWRLKPGTELDMRGYYDAYRFWGSYAYGTEDSPERSVQIEAASADWVGGEAIVAKKLGRHRMVLGGGGEYNIQVSQLDYYVGTWPPILNRRESPGLLAGFGEVELNLSKQFVVNAGGRVDWYSTMGATASPRIAFMYLPSSRTSLKYVVGRAFRAPDPYDTFYTDQLKTQAEIPDLQPEILWSHTVVFERSLRSWLGVTAEGFFNQLDNAIEERVDPTTQMSRFTNGQGDRGRGLELGVDAKRASGWAARASYTWVDTWKSGLPDMVSNSPSHLAKLNGTMPLWRRGSAGVEVLYTGAQENYQGARIGPGLLTNITLSTRPVWGGWQFRRAVTTSSTRRGPRPPGRMFQRRR
jgi:iron complex outermembrane receptor protein